ncbi:CAP domain-containing protein [Sphingomonas sp. ASV193]|uniref:CAP domain-containing protein n=1 Tax=Sphingomonas sp. ASV193 TaxID=3144405 RepID=UPI0032E86DB2
MRFTSFLLVAGLSACAGTSVAADSGGLGYRDASLQSAVLSIHNEERARLGVAGLAWDPALADGAAVWADELARTETFHHSDRHARRGIGENLAMGARGYFSPAVLVNLWLAERRDFRPGVFPNVSISGDWEAIGHYSQMVWRSTTRVGCAVRSSARNDYLVCRYSPAGNMDNRPVY